MEGRTEVPKDLQNTPRVTDNQLPYLKSLALERDIGDEARAELLARIAWDEARPRHERAMSIGRASDFISRLKDKPKLASQPVAGQWVPTPFEREGEDGTFYALVKEGDGATVPDGRYAIETADLPWNIGIVNETNFYRVYVWQPDDKPAGELAWTVKQQVSDDMIKIPRARQYDVLKVIAADVNAALVRYGMEFERCGVCGRGLTNDDSRERGIGPVCAARWGL